MAPEQPSGDDVPTLAQRRASVASRTPDDVQQVIHQFRAGLLGLAHAAPERPDVRRPRRDDVATYRLRVDLLETHPPVWRRLEVASDMFLDELHQVLQGAFGWTDSHLHRYSVGPPYAPDSAVFLCPFDVGEGDDDGIDARTVRLDELMVEPGDRLRYLYDFGDDWDHIVRLEYVGPRPPTSTRAWCTGGRRAGAPEDCGGPWGYAELVEAGEVDGSAFSVDGTNRAIVAAGRPAISWPLVEPRMTRDQLADRMAWLLRRASDGGLTLTSAGWLSPSVVREAFDAWNLDVEWIGKGNRESLTVPVLEVRELAQELRLLRRYKGRLLLTGLGRECLDDPARLEDRLSAPG